MVSVAHERREELESRGEYVVTANAPTGWFAMFPATWLDRVEQARQAGREGPNLVVYRTVSNDARDHHVIPYSVLRDLLVNETLTTSTVDGTRRWNLTLKDGSLHVSHRPGRVDVSEFRGSRLLVEDADFASELTAPTADPEVLERRLRHLRKRHLDRPVGQPSPRKITDALRAGYERRADVKAWVLQEANGRCELCGRDAPFLDSDAEPYLELHHVQQLAEGGPDTVENAVALCANCHRWLHHGADREARRALLYAQVRRLTSMTPSG